MGLAVHARLAARRRRADVGVGSSSLATRRTRPGLGRSVDSACAGRRARPWLGRTRVSGSGVGCAGGAGRGQSGRARSSVVESSGRSFVGRSSQFRARPGRRRGCAGGDRLERAVGTSGPGRLRSRRAADGGAVLERTGGGGLGHPEDRGTGRSGRAVVGRAAR